MGKGKTKKSRKTAAKRRHTNVATHANLYNSIAVILQNKWAVPLFFFALSLLYFFKFVFQDYAFSASDSGYMGSPEKGLGALINPFAERYLWVNTQMGGQPASQGLIQYTFNVFYVVLRLIFIGYRSIALCFVLLTFAAGYFMYVYIRTLNIRKEFAFIAGLFYMFAPMFMSFTYAGHTSKMGVIALLPLMFTCLEKAFAAQKFRYFVYLGGVIALVIGTAHLQYAYFSLWAVGFYFIYKIYTSFRENKSITILLRTTGLFTFAVMLGLMIAARGFVPQYWHTTTVSKRATTPEGPGVTSTFEYAASWPLNQEEAVSLLFPKFSNYLNDYWGRNALKHNSEYFGLYPMLLFIAGLLLWRRERRVRFFTFLFFFAFLFALGPHTPLFKLCYHLIPGLKSFRGPSMISFLFSFSAIVVMAFSLEALFIQRDTKRDDALFNRFKKLLYVAFALGAVFLIFSKPILNLWSSLFSTQAVMQQRMMNNAGAISMDAFLMLLFCGILFLLFWLYHTRKIGVGAVVVVIGIVALADTWRIDKDFLNPQPYSRIPPKEGEKIQVYENLKELDRSPYRVFPENAFVTGGAGLKFKYPEMAMAFGFLDFTLKRFDIVQDRFFNYFPANEEAYFPILNLLNAKYYITPIQRKNENLQMKMVSSPYIVFENKGAFPYYNLVHRYQVIENHDDVFRNVISPGFRGDREVILEKEPPAFAGESADSASIAQSQDEVEFLDSEDFYSRKKNIFRFRVKSDLPGFFILSENYHPEWKATVDGEKTEVYVANYLWKGVFVKAGEHEIVFTFIPLEIIYSRWISLFGFVIFILLLGLTFIVEKRST